MTERNLDIVVVAHQYWPTPGPASLRLGTLVKALVGRGHSVEVWASSNLLEAGDTRVGEHGETLRVLYHAKRGTGASLRRVLSVIGFARAVRAAGYERATSPAVVITDPPPTAALAASAAAGRHSAAFVYYLCDSWELALRAKTGLLMRFAALIFGYLERRALRSANLVLAVTGGLAAFARRSGTRSVLEVRNGVDLTKFNSNVEAESLDCVDATRPVFTYAGTAGVLQGATIFVDAAELLWDEGLDFQVVFVGAGQDMEALTQRAQKHPQNLFVHPSVPPEEAAKLIRGSVASLVSLAPSDSYSDARPTKALASAAVGTPVVYVGDGDFRDELEAADLGYFADWSVASTADAMREALRDAPDSRAQRARITEFARANFDAERVTGALVSRIENLALMKSEGTSSE